MAFLKAALQTFLVTAGSIIVLNTLAKRSATVSKLVAGF